MKRLLKVCLVVAGCAGLAGSAALAQVLPGATVEERAINGAKMYIQKHNLKNPTLTVLQNSLNKNAQPTYDEQWEKLTGIKVNSVPYGYTDIPSKIMAEAVAKIGQWDVFNDAPFSVPDYVGAKVVLPLDEYAKKGKPDFSGMTPSLRAEQYYKGNLYFFLLDGDHIMLALRKDIMELAKKEYKAKFGKEPGCPDTMDELDQMVAYFHTKKGETRWGKTFDKPLYGFQAYRAINYSYRQFPTWFGDLLFDKDMKPKINTPNGIRAIKQFTDPIRKYAPPDVLGWGTPQLYPFWASGQVFAFISFPSIVGYGINNPQSEVKDKQLSCLIPAVKVDGKLRRRSAQAGGIGWFVSRYSKHPELGYYYAQWLTGPTKGDELIADPRGFWDPLRESNRNHKGIIEKYGKELVDVTLENAKYVVSLLLLEGAYEYFNVLDKNLAQVMQGNMSAEEAAKQIEAGWNKITEDIGRKDQIEAWRQGVEMGAYIDKF